MPSITNLRCEGLTEPLGIGMPTPRLSWNISSEIRSARSVAWRLQVWEDSQEHVQECGFAGRTYRASQLPEYRRQTRDER